MWFEDLVLRQAVERKKSDGLLLGPGFEGFYMHK